MKIIKKEIIVDIEPEDYSMSRNGGDYEFGRTIATLENGHQFQWHWCSSEFSFCAISGVHCSNTQHLPVYYGEEPVYNTDGEILELEAAEPSWFWQVDEENEFCVFDILTDSVECQIKVEP